jgi:hypothetical protein
MQREQVVFAMRNGVRMLAGLCTITLTGVAAAQIGLWTDRGGLGLRPTDPQAAASTSSSVAGQQPSPSRDYELYRGARAVPLAGGVASETYSGVAYSLSHRWESSLEAGVVPESASTPRRYSLAGQLGTALSGGQSVSVGLKFRHYDTTSGTQPYSALQSGIGSGYALSPSTLDSSYEVRLNYRYSMSSSFGLALGRDLETVTPGLDTPANGERHLMFTGQHWLTPSWGFTYDLLSDEPGNSMRVQGLRLGVRYRF